MRLTEHETNQMKSILATLLASTALAQANIIITILEDTPQGLDFTIDWGARPGFSWAKSVGTGGSSVEWLGPIGRNSHYDFIEIHAACDPLIKGFGISFWADPDYSGPVLTSLGSPNITFSPPNIPIISAMDNQVYGARFVYGHVPDLAQTGLLMGLGLMGIAVAGRIKQ